ncbi:Helicase domain protein [Enhygromyxa salina]|uniref:Helicase domain protein n=1 Tax=Enhygromyxa salina TaxID=215803 RepID=A0A0C2CVL2_9BACT|nr:DISARM system SNF2-like helicase DrmD [Enhygromyxa salina]KIG15126.1 Helicase domain protein [Enhygromyxa salina]
MPTPEQLAKLSTSAARAQLDHLAKLLGIDREHLQAWLEQVHGRTKLPKALGRLWPTPDDTARERLPMSEELGELRCSDARHDPALQVQLAQILGAPPAVVEIDLHDAHHRARLDNCEFTSSEAAYLAALERRRDGGAGVVAEASPPRRTPAPAQAAEPTSKLPAELAALRVSDARNDDLVLLRLAETLDVSPGRVRAALERAHHRQRLDGVDFAASGPTQELLITPTAPAPKPATYQPPRPTPITANDAGTATSYLVQPKPPLAPASRLPARPPTEPGAAIPKPGQIARCRHRNWLVEAVHPPTVARRKAAHLVDLVCLDDDAPGRELSVLWELELGSYVTEPEAGQLRGLAGFDPPEHFAAYLNTLRWNATTAADATLFQAPLRAGIHVQPYQLTPLMKALELPRANLFIADDVGLGKTIEAGLVMQELLLRQRVEFVLVVGPASVCLQWQEELYKRFGLQFQVYDRAFVARMRQQRGYKVNPWTTHNRFIISYPLLRRAEYLEPLRAFLGAHAEHGKRRKSLLILDEAHTVAPASGSSYAVDSQITRIAREHLCPRFENRLFLSATPHNGHTNSFSALLELLDPQRFHRATSVAANPEALEAVMVRRLKRDIRRVSKGLFPRREVIAMTLHHAPNSGAGAWSLEANLHSPRPSAKDDPALANYARPQLPLAAQGEPAWSLGEAGAPELELARMLADYERTVAPANKRQRLVFANLQKRLLSSTAGFYRTLCAHAQRFDQHFADRLDAQPDNPQDHAAQLELDGEFDRADEAIEDDELQQTATASALLGTPSAQARAQLDAMLTLAKRSSGSADARVRALLEWIRRNQCPAVGLGPKPSSAASTSWGPRKLLIFTEYTDTKRWLKTLLNRAFEGTDHGAERILEIHGALGDERREAIQRAFNAPPEAHPVRILLATDAAREGINLQGACADLMHFDIPWNPARLEQRNGRIDRTLQPEPEARCHYFVYAQREEDRVLDTVMRKVDVIREELGSVGSVVMEQIAATLEGRSIGAQTQAALEAATHPGERQQIVMRELDHGAGAGLSASEKQLDRDIRQAGTRYSDAVKQLNFEPRLLHQALDVALTLLGVGKLEPVSGDGGTQAHAVPELPAGWESTLDALRRPRERDESLWDWRRAAPPQPVVFDPPPQMTSPRVHLHLHHPFVRRLLDVFTSAGFGAHQLEHLALLEHNHNGHAYAVALARVSLFGHGAVRLHDEIVEQIVQVSGDTADGPLEPVSERELGQLSMVLDELLDVERHPPTGSLRSHQRQSLLARARDDLATLWPLARDRAQRAAEAAGARLRKRGEHESHQLEQLLVDQRRLLASELGQQLALQGITNEAERRQSLADRDALKDRFAAIQTEIDQEPAQLRALYEVQLCRIEPIGLVYLWPKVWG